jgi:hypothetical protein
MSLLMTISIRLGFPDLMPASTAAAMLGDRAAALAHDRCCNHCKKEAE